MKKLYLIGNAHLDPVWLWDWHEGYTEVILTYRSALDRMKDFPDFKFTSACAVYFEWVEKTDPEMFEEIKMRIKEGRWEITGGWFLQPDCNIPCSESYARHALISQRYFKKKFGITAKTGYNVDSFGHNAALPKILKQSGMDSYIFMRPQPNEGKTSDTLFMWESDDGSRVCTYRIPWIYNFDMDRIDYFEKLKKRADEENLDYMAFYGVGNHGGGPTIELIDKINSLGIPDMSYTTTDEYFRKVDKEKLPVIKDELQHHARGCYSACSSVKKQNRKCENNILLAEKMSIMAKHLVGFEYPHKKLNKAWKNLMFNQFHDILGGCAIKSAYDDAGYLYGEIMSITEQIINFAMQSIVRKIDTLNGEVLPSYKTTTHWKQWVHEVLGTPVVVFNPYAWKIRVPVRINADATCVTDCSENEIPIQKIRGEQTNGDDKYNTLFIAELDPFGYSTYRFFVEKPETENIESTLTVNEHSLENDLIKVEFDRCTGDICSFYDKKSKKHIIEKSCRVQILDDTENDTWAHDRKKLGEVIGSFDSPQFKVIESGKVRVTLRVKTVYNHSVLIRDYSLIRGSSEISVAAKIDFHEKHRVVKICFPTEGENIVSQIPYGAITREQNTGEEPMGEWIACDKFGIANDSKYGYDTENGYIRITAVRSAIYADHFGKRDEFCEYMEQGINEFTYTVFPYTNNTDCERRANELNGGICYLCNGFHAGTLAEKQNFFECNCDNIIITAIKEAEDSCDDIIRFFDAESKLSNVSLKLFDNTIKSTLNHNEVKTFKMNGDEVNFIEEEC